MDDYRLKVKNGKDEEGTTRLHCKLHFLMDNLISYFDYNNLCLGQ